MIATSDSLNTVLMFCLGIVWTTSYRASGVEYQILGLVPLSGSQNTKGWAQWQGMKLAMEEGLYSVNAIADVKAIFTINDTKCSALTEYRLILDAYWKLPQGRHLVVIGGGCPFENQRISLGDLRSRIPQVLFETKSIHWVSSRFFPVTVRVNPVPAILANVVRFVHLHNWKKIILIHDKNNAEAQREWLNSNDIEVSLNVEVDSLYESKKVLKNSGLRIILLLVDHVKALDVVCWYYHLNYGHFTRYIWLWVVSNITYTSRVLSKSCLSEYRPTFGRIVFFQTENARIIQKVSQVFSHVVSSDLTLTSDIDLQLEAGYSYDATAITLNSLRAIGSATFGTDSDFSQTLAREIKARRWVGVTGNITIDEVGRRHVNSVVYSYINDEHGHKVKLMSLTTSDRVTNIEGTMERDTIDAKTTLEGIPLTLFVIMCSLATLGIMYAIAIMVFNIARRDHRIIKMTSPNINVFILLGCCGVYGAIVMLGLDTTRITRRTMEKLLQASTYVIAIGCSLIYGLVSAKSWRVFMIFKNLTTNGKMTRDEHLLLGLFFMIMIDLSVLIPWHLVDPILCSRMAISEIFEPANMTDITVEVDVCYSEYQNAWVAVLYVYKLIILGLGTFFSWQTRHVTLPALRDARMVYITTCLVIIMAVVALPLLTVHPAGVVVKYAVGGLVLWLTATFTITLLFLTKVLLYRKESKRINQGDSFRFQFSESMKRTQEAIRKLAGCLCCGAVGEDKYAQEMLLTEIECLKRTIKDKDITIRELNDRLYVGAQKFHEYLSNSARQRAAAKVVTEAAFGEIQTKSNRHVMYINNNNRSNSHLDATLGDSEAAKTTQMDNSYIPTVRQISQHSHKYGSSVRIPDLFLTHDRDYYQCEQRLSNNGIQADNTYRGIDTGSLKEVPVYTIQIHRPHYSAQTDILATPANSRRADLQHQERPRLKSSPTFDSAIESNSPDSSGSGQGVRGLRQPHYERTQLVGTGRVIQKDLRFQDYGRGDIDLEAIENEAADPRPNCAHGTPVDKMNYPCFTRGSHFDDDRRRMYQTNFNHQIAPFQSNVQNNNNSVLL